MKTKKYILILFIAMFLLTGYTFPDITPQINFTSNGRNYTVYIPTGHDDQLYYDETLGTIINVSSSSVSGYTYINNTETTVYFPTYNTPYYREGNSYNANTVYLTNIDIISKSNLIFYSRSNALFDTVAKIIMVVLLFLNIFKGGF